MSRALAIIGTVCVLAGATTPADAGAPRGASPEAAKLYESYPVVELVTMGVGALIWERHGHIALCVRYANWRKDVCYNYGTGDFANPVSMGWGFFRGTNSFWVARMRPRSLLEVYTDADRTVWVQPLPLTDQQEQRVIAQLEHDVREENKYYAYDHFWNNCTTRVRDLIDEATGGALSSMPNPPADATFRDLAREGFYGMRIPLLITDIAMGRVTDRVPTYYERMFLPDYMREAVIELWGIQPITVYERKGPPAQKNGPSGRVILALLILLLTTPAWATRLWGRFQRLGLALAIAPPILLGTILWGLAVVSPLPYVRYNESCLIFMPFDLALVAFLSADRRKLYARGRVIMLGLAAVLMLVGVLEQPLMAPLLWPLIPALIVGFWPVSAVPTPADAWSHLSALTRWTPLSELVPADEVGEGLYRVSEGAYVYVAPYDPRLEPDDPRAPFVTQVIWAASDPAARRALLANIEEDDHAVGVPPAALTADLPGATYGALAQEAARRGEMETATYRIATDGAFIHKTVAIANREFYFRSLEANDEELPYAACVRLERV